MSCTARAVPVALRLSGRCSRRRRTRSVTLMLSLRALSATPSPPIPAFTGPEPAPMQSAAADLAMDDKRAVFRGNRRDYPRWHLSAEYTGRSTETGARQRFSCGILPAARVAGLRLWSFRGCVRSVRAPNHGLPCAASVRCSHSRCCHTGHCHDVGTCSQRVLTIRSQPAHHQCRRAAGSAAQSGHSRRPGTATST